MRRTIVVALVMIFSWMLIAPVFGADAGRIAGVLTDPSGALVPGARIEIRNLVSGQRQTALTDRQGHFVFSTVSIGRYRMTAVALGFTFAVIPDVAVSAEHETTANMTLKIAPVTDFVEVNGAAVGAVSATSHKVDAREQAESRNTAEMVGDAPGVSLRENGQLASVPLLHGLGDERAKLVVDGMTVSSACGNHMNPPLSYAPPAQAAQVTVMAGITPVSLGGDSLGGTVIIESPLPVFAHSGERLHEEGVATGFYRSNGQNYGGSFSEWVAGRSLGIGYIGSWASNDDTTDGGGHKVTSTYAQTTDHTVLLAGQRANNLVVVQASLHHTPYMGFVNARMDLVRNYAETVNLRYRRGFAQGVLDAHLYWQNTWHSMDIGRDKSTFPMPMEMPMNTHGRDLGYSIEYEAPLRARHTLRIGNEWHRFVLDDRWPAVAGTAPAMGPNPFISMNNGRRIRLGTFAEVASRWNTQWTTLFGLRNDTVWMNADAVEGYSGMYAADATAFNTASRAHTTPNIDATAMARWEPNASCSYEFGYARKTRAPNLYEHYAWSRNWMASGMLGWFGDGNYYVGNLALKPETAHTVSGTLRWRDHEHKVWEVKIAPYLTAIENYVDVDTLATSIHGMSTFAQLQFANHNARIYGGDLLGSTTLWDREDWGQGRLSGVAGWLHGERLDTQTGLYQMMPLNLRLAFDEERKGFTAGFSVEAVNRKTHLDPRRMEQTTPGYALFHAQMGYRRGHLQANASVHNLFNRNYEMPLGGVNLDNFMASMSMNPIQPLTGSGRSVSASLTAQF
jgi:iron complex outermembrane receptor protein